MNQEVLEAIYEYVRLHPGCSRHEIYKAIGLSKGDLNGRLATMESALLWLYEDDDGKFYPHSRRGVLSERFLQEILNDRSSHAHP